MNNSFLLFYSPKPQGQVRILIYRNWSIDTDCELYGGRNLQNNQLKDLPEDIFRKNIKLSEL